MKREERLRELNALARKKFVDDYGDDRLGEVERKLMCGCVSIIAYDENTVCLYFPPGHCCDARNRGGANAASEGYRDLYLCGRRAGYLLFQGAE